MEKITASLIIEILGKPAEHVKESIEMLVTKLDAEKGVSVIEKKFHEPKPVEGSKELFTTFADLTAEFDTLEAYLNVIFGYMPSHLEVISPENLRMANYDLTDFANKLVQRLHFYDSIAKKMLADQDFLIKKMQEEAPELVKKIVDELKQNKMNKQKGSPVQKEKEEESAPESKDSKKKSKKSKKKN